MGRFMLGLRLLARDWRGGELGLLLAALTVAVTIVVSIALFVDRIQTAILAESSQFLAADRLLRSNTPIPEEWFDIASKEGLEHAHVMHFPTMAFAGDELQLVAVKAADQAYPLLGELEFKPGGTSDSIQKVKQGPPPGEVWVAPRLLPLLKLSVGETLSIGEAQLQISGLVVREPDAGFSVFSFGPRVLMNVADIPRSAVIQPGSRVQHNLLVTGSQPKLQSWANEMEERLQAEQSILGVRDSQPRLARSINRAERFLLLAGSMGVVLAGVAIAIASRRYTERHYDYVGILKSLGASSKTVLTMYLSHLLLLCLCGVLLGSALGWVLHGFAINSIRSLLLVDLPPAGLGAIGLGAFTAFISFFAFACPALLHLQKVAPMRVLRRDLGTPDFNSRLVLWLGIAGLLALIYVYSGSFQITFFLTLGVGAIAALVLFLTWLLLRSAPKPGSRAAEPMRLAVAGIRRRARHSALQVFVFTVVILLVLVLLLARNSLLQEWRMQIPENTPNHFVLNIAPADVQPLSELLDGAGLEHAGIYPMVRASFSAHNGVLPVRRKSEVDTDSQSDQSEDPARNSTRQVQLTWAADLPEDNDIVSGQWWGPEQPGLLSLEQEFAERYGIEVGDTVTFTMVDISVDLEVSSLRQLDWERMRPNFFAIASPGSLKNFDAIYMTSFHLPEGNKEFLNSLIRTVPTVSIIEMDRMIEQVTRIIDQVSSAVELVLGLILLAAVIVLFASIQTSMDERIHESAILKTLGARMSLLRKTMFYEFLLLGALAGSLAAIGAELIIGLIQTRLLELSYELHWWVFFLGPGLGAVSVVLLGSLISASSLKAPPAQVLRQLSA
ncbi:MAG: ABC transporter permease [Pseudomonadales bacterium]